MTRIDMAGRTVGWLRVLECVGRTDKGVALWLTECTRYRCGRRTVKRGDVLRRGATRSCGCYGAAAKRQRRAARLRAARRGAISPAGVLARVVAHLAARAPNGAYVDEIAAALALPPRRVSEALRTAAAAGLPLARCGAHVTLVLEPRKERAA